MKNFARQAKAGVQVKDSHEYKNGFGRTFDGKYESGENRVVSGLRLTRNMPLGEGKSYPESNAFITAIEDEIITQVSIGAYGGDLICNICDASMYSSRDCYHWPLCTYLITDDDGAKEQVVCTATYVGGKLREVSLVDKGACPGAEIMKSRLARHVEDGCISDSHIYLVKSMYGFADGTGFGYSDSGTVKSVVGSGDLDDSDTSGMDDSDDGVDDSVDKVVDGASGSMDQGDSSGDKSVGDPADVIYDDNGDDKMNLEEAKQEIARLEKERGYGKAGEEG